MRYLDFATGTNSSGTSRAERLVIAIDASPSMGDSDWPPSRLEAAKEAAVALVERKLLITPADEVGIVSYAAQARTHSSPVSVAAGAAALCQAIGRIRIGSCTNSTAALRESGKSLTSGRPQGAVERFLRGRRESEPRGRIILLSDGFHNHGDDPEAVATKLKESGICIDCVGIGGDPECVDEDQLRDIASLQPDGVTPRYVFIGDKDNLIQKFEQLAGRITR